MSSSKYLFLIFFFFMVLHIVSADSTSMVFPDTSFAIDTTVVKKLVKQDTSGVVTVRMFDKNILANYLKDDDFIYDRQHTEDASLWERIKSWIAQFLYDLLTTEGSWSVIKIIAYVIAIALIIYLVLKLLQMDKLSFMYGRSKQATLGYTEEGENIHEMSFSDLIANALKEENYRKAVRLYYLKTLKELSDHDFINWKIDKTNRDYANEIQELSVRNKFEDLTLLFEFVWYGEFSTGKKEYEQAVIHFDQFNKDLIKH